MNSGYVLNFYIVILNDEIQAYIIVVLNLIIWDVYFLNNKLFENEWERLNFIISIYIEDDPN